MRKINNLDMSLIRTFVTIVNHNGYAQASQILNLTESAVSHQMKRLEELTGALLFQRKGRVKELTPVGEVFLGYATQILAINDELYERISNMIHENQIIHFGLPEYFAERVLHKLLAEFSKTFPDIEFRTQVKSNFSLSKAINNDSLDFAIVIGNIRSPSSQKLTQEQLIWCGTELHWEEGQPIPLIAFDAPCPFRNAMIECLNQHNIIWHIAYTARNLSDLRAAVKANLGISALPEMSNDTPQLDKDLCSLPELPELAVSLLFPQPQQNIVVNELSKIVQRLW